MSFSVMYNMLGIEYEKVEIAELRVENWWFCNRASTT